MKAKIGIGKEEKREILGKVLPLDTPFTAFINPTTVCNFKCKYCSHSKNDEELKKLGIIKKNISNENFYKAIKQLKDFPKKLKLVYLYGNGEPLCNPNFAKMVKYIKENDVAERVETITNGFFLTKERSLEIIEAGLDRIKISIQGINAKQYKDVTGVDIDFDEFVNRIRYFYENRKQCKVYIKIININMSKEEKEKFYDIFGDMADEIFIENMTYTQRTMNEYENFDVPERNMFGYEIPKCNMCCFPFYVLRVGVDGEINPCFENVFNKNKSVNINNMTLLEYWESTMLRNFRVMHLRNERDKHFLCRGCNCLSATSLPTDIIDNYADEILERMGEK